MIRSNTFLNQEYWFEWRDALDDLVERYVMSDYVDGIDRRFIVGVTGYLYGLDEFACDAMFEHMCSPMNAPKWSDAAIGYLMMLAIMDRSPFGDVKEGFDWRNRIWIDDDCWCWGAAEYSPTCPRHVWRPNLRKLENPAYGHLDEWVDEP